MTVREKTRLDKFKQLLASPNTDLGKLSNKQLEICAIALKEKQGIRSVFSGIIKVATCGLFV